MSSFSDDFPLVPAGDYEPNCIQDLLTWLGVDDLERPAQEPTVAAWLKSHPPGRLMRFTMQRNGFGHLIPEPPAGSRSASS